MGDARAPYSRVYWSVMDDTKFDGIREDVRLFGSWCLMLIVADMAWPAPAFIPPTVPASSVARLEAAELLDLLPGHRFRVHGLNKERAQRSDSARNAAASRWQSEGNARPMLDETRRDETKGRRDETTREDDRPDVEAFLAVRMRLPTPAQRDLMDAYCRVFDETGPSRAAQLIYRHPDDPIGAIKADLEEWRKERKSVADLEDQPKPAPRRKAAGLTGINAELAAVMNERYAAEEKS